ncbi:MAG: hypothetical protein A2498_11885 [Lentisphaerae bacterium RIFOXYC12_FULL_60_16]|nr:MAG: hypothetical protein A2498_11885 [Lentisphaerae bacterium RIFOXYC12_FULL_60_16]OGV72579.1 MAG: hypothetical protein A2269_01120 [Lentisphaerae bacterium RIFOXYA12_FULL_60_10]OGV77299.1 MAG: hypothetical protein A2340_06230 [Lentisphaerae bacterium RIFOXYB12_FULL_60_10]
MISCTEFIPAYSELFKTLERLGGTPAVEAFWNDLSDRFLNNLRDLVVQHGIRGCWLYWSQTLNEEAAHFTMELDEEAGEFRILMHACPSKGRLLSLSHVTPFRDYCRHCDVLYRRVLEPLGYAYHFDSTGCDKASCSIHVRRRRTS